VKVMGELAEVVEVIGELPVVDKVGGGVGGRSSRAKATWQAGEVSVDATDRGALNGFTKLAALADEVG
jgi:hypothetical protein